MRARHPAQLPGARSRRRCASSTTASTSSAWHPVEDPDAARASSASTRDQAVGRLRRPHHPAEGPAVPAARGASCCPPDVQLVLCAGAPDTPQIMAEVEGRRAPAAGDARGRGLDRPAAVAPRAVRGAHRGDDVRLPVGLRAARHREPRGDGVRRGRRRHRDRRHPRGRRRRRHRPARADRAGAGRHRAPRSTPSGSWPISPRRSPRS